MKKIYLLEETLSMNFLIIAGIVTGLILVVFVIDKRQTKEPVRRKFPVLIWGRKTLVALGPLLRQYLFMSDLEETPYNRIVRNWIYKTANGQRNTIGFGSQYDLSITGSVVFLPATFTNKATQLGEEFGSTYRRIIGGRDDVMPIAMPHIVYISGMSYGALSERAVKSLNLGAKKAGIFHNTGEGGVANAHLQGAGLIFQIGTAKYGIRDENGKLDNALLKEVAKKEQIKMFEVKLAQGAKPGKGGMLLKEKITEEIAAIRKVPMGKDALSPPRHAEFDDVDGLFDFIEHVRKTTGKPAGIKMVIGNPAEIESIAKKLSENPDRGPDFITIDGGEGGSGAAPLVLASHAGLPLRQALAITNTTLQRYGVREYVTLFASGKIATPADVAIALALGADAVGIARGFLLSLGCIQSLDCHTGKCPTGITTPSKSAQKAIDVEAASNRVATYAKALIAETHMIAASCGYKDPTELSPNDVMVQVEPGRFDFLGNISAIKDYQKKRDEQAAS